MNSSSYTCSQPTLWIARSPNIWGQISPNAIKVRVGNHAVKTAAYSFSTFSHTLSKKALLTCSQLKDKSDLSPGKWKKRHRKVWDTGMSPHVLSNDVNAQQALAGAACGHSLSSASSNVRVVSTESEFSIFKEYFYFHLDFYASIQLINSSDYWWLWDSNLCQSFKKSQHFWIFSAEVKSYTE